jgi:biopolymer transport protein ExbB
MFDSIYASLAVGGIWMIPIYFVSLWGMWVAIDLYWVQARFGISRGRVMTKSRFAGSLSQWAKNLSKKERRTAVGQVLERIWEARAGGREAMENVLDEEMKYVRPQIDHGLDSMQVLAASAPLLGLVGTVSGMVHTFEAISIFGTNNPSYMSEGISEALVCTQNGLIAALPIMFAHMLLAARRNRIESLTMKTGQRLINYLCREAKS